MVKYKGPRIRITRRLGLLPGLSRKITKKSRILTPGQHGKPLFGKKTKANPKLKEDYKNRLIEKQKLRFNYGVSESQLVSYYKQAKKATGSTGNILLELLESRLDCIVYRLGLAPTIPAARQLINHGHFLVNQKKVTIPSFLCKVGDLVSIKESSKAKKLITENFNALYEKRKLISKRMKKINLIFYRYSSLLPSHLKVDSTSIVGRISSSVKRYNVLVKVNELKVIEYYSK
jgi:small subunit ribosomal protein S4